MTTSDSIRLSLQVTELPLPVSERAVSLKHRMSAARWHREVQAAQRRLHVVLEVKRLREEGFGKWRDCLRQVDPKVHWSTYCHWRLLVGTAEGPAWERLLDARLPEPAKPIPPEVAAAAEALRRSDPWIRYAQAREKLQEQFGKDVEASYSTLGRVWRRAGLANYAAGDVRRFEKVDECGGAALTLVGAAAAESGIPLALAVAALEAGKAEAAKQTQVPQEQETDGRDARGHFTSAYNKQLREGLESGQADTRWDSEQSKRKRCHLASLSVLSLSAETLAQRILVMGMVPLVSRMRGFDGLDTPQARWLRVLGWPAYQPATVDKTLAELALLKTDTALWTAHEKQWTWKAQSWAPRYPDWRSMVRYVDITGEPHWTDKFAQSGKVSRSGRVMPCLQRVTVTAGPGVVIWMRTLAGGQSLRKQFLEWLKKSLSESDLGRMQTAPEQTAVATPQMEPSIKKTGRPRKHPLPGPPCPLPLKAPNVENETAQPFAITVMDAEAGQAGFLWQLGQLPKHCLVTVLKGHILTGAKTVETGPWMTYRERDRVREVTLTIHGQGAPSGGVQVRAVEMERADTRHPHRITYVTDAAPDFLSTVDVPDVHLSRWRNQEHVFRMARQGTGLEHSQGFTGEYVANEDIDSKRKDALRAVERASKERDAAQEHASLLADAKKNATGTERKTADRSLSEANRTLKQAEARCQATEQEVQRLATMPEKIHQRDTTRENIATPLTMTVLGLVMWVLREYMGDPKMELATFLEYFLAVPVEMRTNWFTVTYNLDASELPTTKAAQLQRACEEITRRRISRGGRRLKFVAVLTKSRDHPQ